MNEPASSLPALPEERAPVPWRTREGIVIWFLALLSTAVPVVVGLRGNALFVTIVLVNQLALLGGTLLWIRGRYGAGLRELGYRGIKSGEVSHGLGIGAAGILVSFLIGWVVLWVAEQLSGGPVDPPRQIDLETAPNAPTLVLIGIAVVLVAPIAEELFFRGFVYSAMRRWAAPASAMALSALVFALAHLFLLVIPSIFVLGVILAATFERRNDIVAPAVAHMVFNAFAFVIYLAQGAPT